MPQSAHAAANALRRAMPSASNSYLPLGGATLDRRGADARVDPRQADRPTDHRAAARRGTVDFAAYPHRA